jgi:acetyl esterase
MAGLVLPNKVVYDVSLAMVSIKRESVTTKDGTKIKLIVYKPKVLFSSSAPCYIWAHGGGGVMFTAEDHNGLMAMAAVNLGCVVISVDYRLGPEVKCPTGQ